MWKKEFGKIVGVQKKRKFILFYLESSKRINPTYDFSGIQMVQATMKVK